MSNYLYNGVELPELPEWDKESYPKALIYKWTDSAPYRIICYSEDPKHTGTGGDDIDDIVNFRFPALFYELDESTNTWVFMGHSDAVYEGDTSIWITDVDMIWANTDIIVETTVLGKHMKVEFLASDPVPVEGETTSTTPTNADYYIRKNGKWYKNKGGASSGTSSGGTSGGTGTAIPTPTTDDNGKFLRVVDGAYALVALTDVSVEGA